MVVTKRSHIRKQTCSGNLQVCLSMCDLLLPPSIKGLMPLVYNDKAIWKTIKQGILDEDRCNCRYKEEKYFTYFMTRNIIDDRYWSSDSISKSTKVRQFVNMCLLIFTNSWGDSAPSLHQFYDNCSERQKYR